LLGPVIDNDFAANGLAAVKDFIGFIGFAAWNGLACFSGFDFACAGLTDFGCLTDFDFAEGDDFTDLAKLLDDIASSEKTNAVPSDSTAISLIL
jgi:hypothetical protein